MSKINVFVDGENFFFKIEEVLKKKKLDKRNYNLSKINLGDFIKSSLEPLKNAQIFYYVAKINFCKETPKKSKELILFQRNLETSLEKQGVTFVVSGNVRAQKIIINGKSNIVFKEKGVDVKIAVDLVARSCDKKIDTAVLFSSDSDLQPAVSEAKSRGVKVVYLGFESNPNKGLMYTSNKTILIPDKEVISLVGLLKK